ncbi:MAG: hypothetical protein JRJ54_13080 [Deltaproteobacteria bacterium]|nr:hypothetical protein [Deltaproteobacteria bacterium]
MQPDIADVRKDQYLTQFSIGYKNAMFIADRVFPNVPVVNKSDSFFKFKKGAWFRADAGYRAPGTPSRRSGYVLADDNYSCKERSLAHPVPIELLNNSVNMFNPILTGTRYVTNQVLLAKELAVAGAAIAASVWTTEDDVAGAWVADTDGSSNTFISDVETNKETVRQLIGVYPNVLVMDAKTWKEVKNTYAVLERVKYTGGPNDPAKVTPRSIAALFDLEDVIIAPAIYSDAEEVADGTDFNAVDIWEVNAGKGSALLFYRPAAPAIEEPSAGYVFNWPGSEGVEGLEMVDAYRTIRRWFDKDAKSWIIECSEYFDVQVTCADAGVLFKDTILT